jgi:azurin
VKIHMKNNATPDSNMFHNVVVAKPGTEAQVANAGIQAGEAHDWVKEGPDVLAHTPLAKPGETTSIVFRAPAAGDYPYICTFPGHAAVMKGVMKVQ